MVLGDYAKTRKANIGKHGRSPGMLFYSVLSIFELPLQFSAALAVNY